MTGTETRVRVCMCAPRGASFAQSLNLKPLSETEILIHSLESFICQICHMNIVTSYKLDKAAADQSQQICATSATLMCVCLWVRDTERKVCALPGCVLRCLQVVWTDWLPATGDYCRLHTSSHSSPHLQSNTSLLIQHYSTSAVFYSGCHNQSVHCVYMVDSWVRSYKQYRMLKQCLDLVTLKFTRKTRVFVLCNQSLTKKVHTESWLTLHSFSKSVR